MLSLLHCVEFYAAFAAYLGASVYDFICGWLYFAAPLVATELSTLVVTGIIWIRYTSYRGQN